MALVDQVRGAYATLGVPFGSPPDAVRSAYRVLVRNAHPDTGDAGPAAVDRLAELRTAYERLRPTLPPPTPSAEGALAAYGPPLPPPRVDVRD